MAKRSSLKKVMVGAVATGAILALSLGVQAQAATEAPTPTAIPSMDLGSGGTHIELWDGLTGSDGSTLDSMLSQFVKENPGISITDEEIDWGTFYTKLQAAFVAGDPPDMFIFHFSEIPVFASEGLLMDTSNLYDDHGGTLPAK